MRKLMLMMPKLSELEAAYRLDGNEGCAGFGCGGLLDGCFNMLMRGGRCSLSKVCGGIFYRLGDNKRRLYHTILNGLGVGWRTCLHTECREFAAV